MESIINKICDDEVWKEYLEFKINQSSITNQEINELTEYIESRKYEKIAKEIKNGDYKFSIPEKHLINKINKSKKRVVYTFNYDENMIFKIISYLFSKKYEKKYSDNCYSFRKKYSVRTAIKKIAQTPNIDCLFGYKVDIENYFNSVNTEIMLNKLQKFLEDDEQLFNIIKEILTSTKVKFNNQIINESKGIMAGVPISSFLANIYLQDADEYFAKRNILYARYSDDIIFFAKENEIEKYVQELKYIIR